MSNQEMVPKLIRAAFPLVLLQLLPSKASVAQGNPGTNLVVDVKVALVTLSGDTTTVRYILLNRVESQESLYTFTVSAPAPVLKIVLPSPDSEWAASTDWRTKSVAHWASLALVMPGDSTPPLEFRARGLPGIDTAWYRGYSLNPPTNEDNPDTTLYVDVPEVDPLVFNNVQIQTVGIDAVSPTTTNYDLVIRLGSLRGRACSLGWITDATLCSSLQAKLDKAARDLQHGKNATAKSDLQSFNDLLTANHGPGTSQNVSDSAYWLLKVNADYLIGRL